MLKLNLKDIIKILNVKSNKKYTQLVKATKVLTSTPLTIRYVNESGDSCLLQTTWLASAEYRKGFLEIEFSNKLMPFLLGLKDFFASYQLINILSLTSQYSIRIYEMLKANLYKKSLTISFDELREVFILENKYKRFSDFKKRILDKTKSDLTKSTDLTFDYIVLKKNKKQYIIFKIFANNNLTQIKESVATEYPAEYEVNDIELIQNKIKNLNIIINPLQICKLLEVKSVNLIHKYIDNFHKFKCNKHNKAGFFIEAVLNEYNIPIEEINEYSSNKPIQSTNFTQREYDDDFFESLYDNFRNNKIKE